MKSKTGRQILVGLLIMFSFPVLIFYWITNSYSLKENIEDIKKQQEKQK